MTEEVAADREKIAQILESVAGIGVVHRYERFSASAAKMKELYLSGVDPDKRLHGWNIRRRRWSEKQAVLHGPRYQVTEWQIKGFMGVDDADQSEIIFDNLIDRIADAFRDHSELWQDLHDVIDSDSADNDETGIQLEDAGPVMFCGVLCHSCRLRLITGNYK